MDKPDYRNINLIIVSRLSSDILDRQKFDVIDLHQCKYNDVILGIYNLYPKLEENDYVLYYRYTEKYMIKLKDFFTYGCFLATTYDPTLFLLLNDTPENWDDNMDVLHCLDLKEDYEKRERERDIYDVKIIREGDEEETFSNCSSNADRTDYEIIMYAINRSNMICTFTKDIQNKRRIDGFFKRDDMKGEIISCTHKDIYFLETNTKSETTDLANLFGSAAGRDLVKYKPRTKLKHKLNPALEFFIHNKATKTVPPQSVKSSQDINNCAATSTTHIQGTQTPNGVSTEKETASRSRKNSIDLYEEAATILGLTCSQTDSCKCLECQCHYFDFEEEIDFPTGGECLVDHTSSCSIQ